MHSIEIKRVISDKDLVRFIKLPWKIYQSDPHWVPPLIMDRKKLLNRKKNPFYRHAEMEMLIAFKDGQPAGRIAAITNANHNSFQGDNNGFFGFYESVNDPEITRILLDETRHWLIGKGKDGMLGPINPSTNDELGLLIEGFETPPFVMMCHNPAYYQTLLENYGLKKAKDLYAWYVDVRHSELPEKLINVAETVTGKYGITIRNIQFKNLQQDLERVREVYNNAWSRNWGFVPLSAEEIDYIANDLKQIAREELILLAEKDGKPVAFSMTLPNINEVLITIRNGKLFPTGFIKLLRGMKKIKTARVITLGVVKEFQTVGLGAILYLETILRARKLGMAAGEMSWILEDNQAMNSAIAMFGSTLYKKYRIYQQKF
jgi:GNAT superfamily N-acetyltransferase